MPPPRAITGAIHLQETEIRAGRTVRGEVVFENRISKTRVLMSGCKVDGLYGVALHGSGGYDQAPAFSLVGCRPTQMVATPGTTVYRFKVAATYSACSQSVLDRPPRSSKYWTPLCLMDSSGKRDIMPPLPAGSYKVVFIPNGKWHGPPVRSAHLLITGV